MESGATTTHTHLVRARSREPHPHIILAGRRTSTILPIFDLQGRTSRVEALVDLPATKEQSKKITASTSWARAASGSEGDGERTGRGFQICTRQRWRWPVEGDQPSSGTGSPAAMVAGVLTSSHC
jgi:hypothetical protein